MSKKSLLFFISFSLAFSYQNVKVDNIQSLEQLNRSLMKIEEILKKKNLLKEREKQKELEKKLREKRRKKELLKKKKETIKYIKELANLKQEEQRIKAMKFKASEKYIKELLSIVKKRVKVLLNDIDLLKVNDIYVLRGFNQYSIANSKRIYVSLNELKNALAYLNKNRFERSVIEEKIKQAIRLLKLLKMDIVKTNYKTYIPKLETLANVLSDVNKILKDVMREELKVFKFNKKTNSVNDSLAVYEKPTSSKKIILLKEGDMISQNVQVKKITNSYLILEYKKGNNL